MTTWGECRACGRPIRWEATANDRRTPVNLDDGAPHWASCPEADRFRARRTASRSAAQLDLVLQFDSQELVRR